MTLQKHVYNMSTILMYSTFDTLCEENFLLEVLVPTGKCNTLGYATLGLGLAPRILLF